MSQLSNARRQASMIRTFMRQGKIIPAIQALHEATLTMLKNPLMKSERDEFEKLIEDGIYHIMADQHLRTSLALQITYKAGHEKEFLEDLRMLMEVLQEDMHTKAQASMAEMDERKKTMFQEARAKLAAGLVSEASKQFAALAGEFKNDSALYAEIGECLLAAKQYDEAARYLGDALVLTPGAVHLYNQLAMAQRKMGRFDEAEQSYFTAAKADPADPHLFFNLGRLYIDWQRWEPALKAAKRAIDLQPGFEEAQKMAIYAEKKLGILSD